jgi:hypothetical protein
MESNPINTPGRFSQASAKDGFRGMDVSLTLQERQLENVKVGTAQMCLIKAW